MKHRVFWFTSNNKFIINQKYKDLILLEWFRKIKNIEAIYNFITCKTKQEVFINDYLKDNQVKIEFWKTILTFNF